MATLHEPLRLIMPYATTKNVDRFAGPLAETMAAFGINTVKRQAAFLAQVAVESGSLAYVREIASGEAYEGRQDLGNIDPGDGVRFKGRGLLQITGRANYRECGRALGLPLEEQPELLEQPEYAAKSAGWFWLMRGLNPLADSGDIIKVSRRINGGTNGLAPRVAFYNRAVEVLREFA